MVNIVVCFKNGSVRKIVSNDREKCLYDLLHLPNANEITSLACEEGREYWEYRDDGLYINNNKAGDSK